MTRQIPTFWVLWQRVPHLVPCPPSRPPAQSESFVAATQCRVARVLAWIVGETACRRPKRPPSTLLELVVTPPAVSLLACGHRKRHLQRHQCSRRWLHRSQHRWDLQVRSAECNCYNGPPASTPSPALHSALRTFLSGAPSRVCLGCGLCGQGDPGHVDEHSLSSTQAPINRGSYGGFQNRRDTRFFVLHVMVHSCCPQNDAHNRCTRPLPYLTLNYFFVTSRVMFYRNGLSDHERRRHAGHKKVSLQSERSLEKGRRYPHAPR